MVWASPQVQMEELGADRQGGRGGALYSGREASKPFKDPDYFPLNNNKQTNNNNNCSLPLAPLPFLASGDQGFKQLSIRTVNTAQLPQLSRCIKVPGVRGNLNI